MATLLPQQSKHSNIQNIQEPMKFYNLNKPVLSDANLKIDGFSAATDYERAWKALNDR